MWTKQYLISVAFVTIIAVITGYFLWNNAGERKIEPGNGNCSGYCLGPEDAPVTIDAYVDFTCHICVEKGLLIAQALEMYPERLRFIYHHYPESDFSNEVAQALEYAGSQGMFWDLYEEFIANPPTSIGEIVAISTAVGLSSNEVSDALESNEFLHSVEAARQEAVAQGVYFVGVFINGKEYEKYPGTLEDLVQAIELELKKTGG